MANGSVTQALTIPARHGMGFDNMRTYLQAKAMAKSLRESLAGKNVSLSHSECLEIVAQQFGFGNWNVLAAKIEFETRVARTAQRERRTSR